jgi:hypothetical protein
MPVYFTDATGEHVSLNIVVDAAAAPSDRLVLLTTPYGSTGSTPDTTNTLKIFKPLAGIAPLAADSTRVASAEAPGVTGTASLSVAKIFVLYGVTGRKLDGVMLLALRNFAIKTTEHSGHAISKDRVVAYVDLPDASRGPPEAIG